MRTEIFFGEEHHIFEAPEGVYLVGVTVLRGGNNFSTINGLTIDGVGATDEEIQLSDGTNLIFHYYSMPILAKLMEEFRSFPGMKFIEIQDGDFRLFQTV